MALNSIQKEWEGFAAMIFAKIDPSPVQVEETRRAFFAGAWVVINACKEIGEPTISEEEGEAWFQARNEECLAFQKQLMQNYVKGN